MERINDISIRTTDGMALQFGYDDDTSWPLTWYTRNYPNTRYYGNQPGKDLRDLPVIVVGDNNYGKIEPVVGQAYYRFDYIRMVWPNQDYFNLTLARLRDAIDDPAMRSALFQVWLNRDFSAYSEATGREVNLENWSPADTMRLYIRKDVAARLWDYAAAPVSEEIVADPYEGGEVDLIANQAIGSLGSDPGQFLAPRDVALAQDGSLYITDTENNRIQHVSAEGEVLHIWGSFADATAGDAPGSTFNQPWGIAVGPDGSVYVADTWNHRIQKFTPEGELLTMWGYFGQAETPDAFWGPRDVAVDNQGRVFVVDTGNKRVVVFDANGAYLNQFGGFGLEAGKFDEPVGVTIDSAGQVYVADTWNQRIQVFQEAEGVFYADKIWEVAAWYGQSLDNKPYITVNAQGQIFISDPESPRVIEFDPLGQFVRYWGGFSPGLDGFSLINGLAAENQSGIWVVDSGAGRILHFTLP
jgi:sugar lactone lactonase YvrE